MTENHPIPQADRGQLAQIDKAIQDMQTDCAARQHPAAAEAAHAIESGADV
jgi:hypothetical protein